MQDPTVEDMQEIVNKLTKENQQLHTAQLGEYEI